MGGGVSPGPVHPYPPLPLSDGCRGRVLGALAQPAWEGKTVSPSAHRCPTAARLGHGAQEGTAGGHRPR